MGCRQKRLRNKDIRDSDICNLIIKDKIYTIKSICLREYFYQTGEEIMTIKITGTGSALPPKAVTNDDLAKIVDTSDEWIRERTGICERRISTGQTTTDLAVEAAKKALEDAGKASKEVELIIVATVSGDWALPCCACQVQAALGADKAVAFDVNAACSGFLFGLNIANAYISSGAYKNALIIGSETLSKIVDWSDRSTCILFGDGAGAAFVEARKEESIFSFLQGSVGADGAALQCKNRELSNLFVKPETEKLSYVEMDGQEVYRFAVMTVSKVIKEAIDKAGIEREDINWYILHQANIRIVESIAKRLRMPMERFPYNLDTRGNISAASIPILLDELNKSGKLKRGDKIVLSGFGAGLTYGATVMIW